MKDNTIAAVFVGSFIRYENLYHIHDRSIYSQ